MQAILSTKRKLQAVKIDKAVLFDMDGLIADTEEIHVKSYHKIARILGINLTDEYIHSFIGVSTKDNIKKIINDFGIEKDFEYVLELRYKFYIENINSSNIKAMGGALETIEISKKLGAKTALVTSSLKEHAFAVLNKIFDRESLPFDIMIFGDDVQTPKPDPEIYIKASKKLNVKPENCIVFEDSEAGIKAAKNAGMIAIAVPNYHTKDQDFRMADFKYNSLKDVLNSNILEKLLLQHP